MQNSLNPQGNYKGYQRFINDQLKGSIEELSHQVYLCIQDHKALEAAILMIDGMKFEANANKMMFFWGAWVKRYRPRYWQKAMEIVRQLKRELGKITKVCSAML